MGKTLAWDSGELLAVRAGKTDLDGPVTWLGIRQFCMIIYFTLLSYFLQDTPSYELLSALPGWYLSFQYFKGRQKAKLYIYSIKNNLSSCEKLPEGEKKDENSIMQNIDIEEKKLILLRKLGKVDSHILRLTTRAWMFVQLGYVLSR